MNEYDEDVVKNLNIAASEAVEGSEFGGDEHLFGIAAEIIKDSHKEIAELKEQLTHSQAMHNQKDIALKGILDAKDKRNDAIIQELKANTVPKTDIQEVIYQLMKISGDQVFISLMVETLNKLLEDK